MNLHGAASRAIASVNPMIAGTVYTSTNQGTVTLPGGKRYPILTAYPQKLQVQAISEKELLHLDALNIGGVLRKVYLFHDWNSVNRITQAGGDLMTFSGQLWLVKHVFETWPDWSSVAVVLQEYMVPSPPKNPVASVDLLPAGEVIVTFLGSPFGGGLAIDGYTITAKPGGAFITVASNATTAHFTGLDPATAYTFTVIAFNAVGPSIAAGPSNAVTPAGGG